jgi:phenylalanyl-tRNA synthetase beta chain
VRLDADLSRVIVGEVKTLVQHPHADRLKVAKVDVGAGALWEIVCGAPNVAAGQKVAVAPVGVTLPNGTVIEERRIRGLASSGMICAEDELGLGTDHGGILVLDRATPVGQSLKAALGLPEVILDLDLTPNRGDCYSILALLFKIFL